MPIRRIRIPEAQGFERGAGSDRQSDRFHPRGHRDVRPARWRRGQRRELRVVGLQELDDVVALLVFQIRIEPRPLVPRVPVAGGPRVELEGPEARRQREFRRIRFQTQLDRVVFALPGGERHGSFGCRFQQVVDRRHRPVVQVRRRRPDARQRLGPVHLLALRIGPFFGVEQRGPECGIPLLTGADVALLVLEDLRGVEVGGPVRRILDARDNGEGGLGKRHDVVAPVRVGRLHQPFEGDRRQRIRADLVERKELVEAQRPQRRGAGFGPLLVAVRARPFCEEEGAAALGAGAVDGRKERRPGRRLQLRGESLQEMKVLEIDAALVGLRVEHRTHAERLPDISLHDGIGVRAPLEPARMTQPPDVRQADRRVGRQAVAGHAAEKFVAADPKRVQPPVPHLFADVDRGLQHRDVLQHRELRLEQPAILRERMKQARQQVLVGRERIRVAGFRRRATLPAHGADPLPEANQPTRRLQRGAGLSAQVLQELVDEHHVRAAVDANGTALVLELADVARRAVEPDHLGAEDGFAADRDAHGQAPPVASALRIGQQAVALDVVHERPHFQRAVGGERLGLEREEVVEREQLAAFRQVVVGLPFFGREAVLAFGRRRRRERRRGPDGRPDDSGRPQEDPAKHAHDKHADDKQSDPALHAEAPDSSDASVARAAVRSAVAWPSVNHS